MEAAFADVTNDDMFETATEERHVTAYVMLPRAKFLRNLWLKHAFGRQLFSRGPPLGPHLLLRKLRGEISTQAVMREFAAAAEKQKKEKRGKVDVMKAKFRCTACFLTGHKESDKPPAAFGANCPADVLPTSPATVLGRVARRAAITLMSAGQQLGTTPRRI